MMFLFFYAVILFATFYITTAQHIHITSIQETFSIFSIHNVYNLHPKKTDDDAKNLKCVPVILWHCVSE